MPRQKQQGLSDSNTQPPLLPPPPPPAPPPPPSQTQRPSPSPSPSPPPPPLPQQQPKLQPHHLEDICEATANMHFIDDGSLDELMADIEDADVLSLIRVNVGGRRFEVLKSTLMRQHFIYEKLLHDGVYRAGQEEYFFDRDPTVFNIVLWYCRYGELHVPHHLCGPLLERELALWGIHPAIEVQNCCVSHLMDTKSRLISLKQFENFFKEEMETEPVVPLDCGENDDFGGPTSSSSKGWQRVKAFLASLRRRCWKILDHPSSGFPATVYAVLLTITVLYAVFSFVASTSEQFQRLLTQREIQFYSNKHPSWYGNHTDAQTRIKADWLVFSDWFAFGVLTFDFLVRLLCCKNKLAYFKNAYTVIDLLSILPFYVNELLKLTWGIIEFSEPNSFGVTEYIAFLKISLFVRLLRIGRHYRGLQVLVYTLKTSLRDLMLMGVFVALGTLLFSTLIFFCEKSRSGGETHLAPTAPPDKKKVDCSKCQKGDTDSKFNSMFDGFWWSLVTMTTVGYGDLVPQTSSGRIVGSACALSGLLLIAFTVPILVNHFMLYYSHSQIVHVSRNSVQEYATKALLAKVNSFAGGKVKKMKKLVSEGASQATHSQKLGKAYWKKRLHLRPARDGEDAAASKQRRACARHSQPLLAGPGAPAETDL
ncbi:hypothetical protein BOX15_Mlig014518g2 [Macrostomum lignano]|uniref:BTB domain-containing protein n=1 Tax=Macrostomum lignano TaxID=282301 RepID=A0A267H2F4_9PLAT|nr:hypothetical protein BOX15_Mlig014518g2 [Macrostomum lignano]